jgi:hypothetical protein
VAEIHYQHTTERVVDRGRLGLFFERRPTKAASDLVIDVKSTRADATMTSDTTLLAMRPELPPDIKSLEVKARRPDGGTDVLLFAKDFSPKWPTPFVFADPVVLRRGTVLSVIAHGDAPARLRFVTTVP